MNSDQELIYIWDAYCGWCHGFSKTVHRLHNNHPELPLTILSGGLFTGNRSQAIGAFPHIAEANQRISQLTGAEFGSGYQELLHDGSFVMDSELAAIGFYALRSVAPEHAIELAAAMQHAFYVEGKSLSEPETYRTIALANHIDAEAVLTLFHDPASQEAARAEFADVSALGVNSYPTLLLRSGNEYTSIGGTMNVEEIEARLAKLHNVQPEAALYCAMDSPEGC
ncbi:DsbA family protein [Paenibacillus hunanensis]|uniref:DSBA-like thioredoxin domain-containing protein n=1 Tax=Paenibacillus hunanensis TaxID=539262 RepID=A0ABU1J184_9BACL|nr:DsbA family protein [Paenibacillus hunanensis]MDR6244253.1 putative protein-disulfide isomerase [Paenibacillus hunanensis]GGJ18282.1 DsbA family protein [Paenibacillus hunanensis]